MKLPKVITGVTLLLLALALLSSVFDWRQDKLKQTEPPCTSVKMTINKQYTHLSREIRVTDGAVMIKEEDKAKVVLYTDFDQPTMTVSQDYLAFFAYPESHFFLYHLPTEVGLRVDTNTPVSGMKLTENGYALAISDTAFTVSLYDKEGSLVLTLKAHLPICDATVTENGKRVCLLLFSAETEKGFTAEIFHSKTGKNLRSVPFTYEGILACHYVKDSLYFYRNGRACGYVKRGKFHLFGETP